MCILAGDKEHPSHRGAVQLVTAEKVGKAVPQMGLYHSCIYLTSSALRTPLWLKEHWLHPLSMPERIDLFMKGVPLYLVYM